jgi:hypothetical protein
MYVTKHVYIEPRQDRMLKERARRYGSTEADLIRQALDHALDTAPGTTAAATTNLDAWRRIERFARKRRKGGGRRVRRRWTRESLYDRA